MKAEQNTIIYQTTIFNKDKYQNNNFLFQIQSTNKSDNLIHKKENFESFINCFKKYKLSLLYSCPATTYHYKNNSLSLISYFFLNLFIDWWYFCQIVIKLHLKIIGLFYKNA